jgi:hypothetical protein
MFRVDCVRKGSDNYFKGLEDYVGKILELNTQAGVDSFGSVALFTPDKKDYWHFDNEWVTEISEQYNLLNPERKHESPLDKQVSGTHYKDCGIQPIEYIHANGLNYFEGNAVKYITRHRKKNGKADIEKAIHYLELMLELEYKEGK